MKALSALWYLSVLLDYIDLYLGQENFGVILFRGWGTGGGGLSPLSADQGGF